MRRQWNFWLISPEDARHALNAIELGIMTTKRSEDEKIHITLEVAQECIQKRAVRYDKTGDNHYDTVSAFIKSMKALIRMRQFIIWRGCCMQGKALLSLQGEL